MPEHVVFFDRYDSRYPYNESGVLDLGADPGIFDPFLALTVAALATTRLKLGTSVLLIGERNPLLTAREAATLDQITGGRFLLGVGVGWSQEEYEALGVPWERRGERCDEYIQVMKEAVDRAAQLVPRRVLRLRRRDLVPEAGAAAAPPRPRRRQHPAGAAAGGPFR